VDPCYSDRHPLTEYIDRLSGLTLGCLTDPQQRRVARKMTTQMAATVGCRDTALIKL